MLRFFLPLALAGCSTTLSTLQPAEPMKPLHFQSNAALDIVVPASRVADAVDAAAHYDSTTAGQRKALAAAVGLGLSSPGVNPDVMLRMGVVKDLDVGVRWSALTAHADAKYRFLGEDGPGLQGAVSLGVSKALYDGFVFSVLDDLHINDYSRWNLEVPIIFGARMSEYGHVWFGPKYVYSHYSLDASLKEVGIVPELSGSIHHLGGFAGAALGYKVFFVVAELTVAKMWANPEVFGQKTDLGGILVVPSVGFMLRL